MIRLIILSFFIYSNAAWSSPVEHSLICKEADQDSDSGSLALSFEGGVFSLIMLIADVGQIMFLEKRQIRLTMRLYFLIQPVMIWG